MRFVKGEYDKLYDQVKSGKRTVCYVDYDFFKSDKPPVRDICTIKPIQLELSARGICYGMLDSGKPEKEAFIEMCESSNVEWLCEDEQDEGWVPVDSRPLVQEDGEVIAFHPKWVDADFNPNGIRMGFINGDGRFWSAHWSDYQDTYQNSVELMPTHYMRKPKPPIN